ncbi:MAG: Na/Pi cotransporter family protein [Chitinophagales bacterium]
MDVIFAILQILGSLGIFIYGMKLMSEGIQNAAGDKLRSILSGMTKNKYLGILTGFFITTLVQSSSATTVMVVSFVNAGLLTLTESLGVIMGANIGTTVTLWIIAVLGKFPMTKFAIALIGLSFPFIFSKKDKVKYIAEFILGFGILFIGLDFLKGSVPDIRSNPEMLSFVQNFTDLSIPYASIILFVIFGSILTLVVQSSSAATAITLTLLIQGWIPFELACAMILGENIGTTVTANIAAAIGNVHAKRAARFHFIFNVLGVVWILILFIPYTSIIHGMLDSALFSSMADFLGKNNERIGLAIFHTSFNIINVLMLMWFSSQIASWVIKIVPSVTDDDEEFKLQHISTGLMSTPELSLMEARKEIRQFAKLVEKMSSNVYDLFFEKQKKVGKLIDKIKDREDITDRMDLELNDFLAKVSESDISKNTSNEIKQLLSMSGDMERIADIYFEITKNFERLKREEVELPANAKEEIKEIMLLVIKAISFMRTNLNEEKQDIQIKEIISIEKEINAKRKEVFTNHFLRLEKGIYTPKQGVLFIDFVNRCERIGDHIMNVHEAILGVSDLYAEVEKN